jgi:leucyl/phenylalanyl-tRNA--protein transferase
MPVYRLDARPVFPPAHLAGADGLLAIGGDLGADRLLAAYAQGIFPWPHEGLPLMWFSPDPRAVLVPRQLRISRSLRARLRRGEYEVRFDSAFRQVMEGCANAPRPGQDGTWITRGMIEAYVALHEQGLAHSVEAWKDGELVGGLYGVSLGAAFFGESMFARATDASKVAFATLAARVDCWGFRFVDCQMSTPHLLRLGAVVWPRRRYLAVLDEALAHPTRQGRWPGPSPEERARLHRPGGLTVPAGSAVVADPSSLGGEGLAAAGA